MTYESDRKEVYKFCTALFCRVGENELWWQMKSCRMLKRRSLERQESFSRTYLSITSIYPSASNY